MQGELDLVWKHLLPAMSAQALSRDRQAQDQLLQTLASRMLPPLQGQATPPLAGRIAGKVFQLETNDLGLESASFARCMVCRADSKEPHG